MPKGKNAAALFEVMGKTRAASANASTPKGGLPTPTWWKSAAPGAARGETVKAGETSTENHVGLDPDRQQVTVKVSYTIAAIILFAVVTAIGVAVIVGREMSTKANRPQTTAELLKGPAEPNVLNVNGTHTGGGAGGGKGNGGGTPQPIDISGNLPGSVPAPLTSTPDNKLGMPIIAADGKVTRTSGLNYVIAQSYPTEAEARLVAEFLTGKGVPASAERLPTWNKSGWTVVSAEGFPAKTNKSELDALKRKMDQISVERAQTDRKWKMLTPVNFGWKG